jgi:hypothetical protein
MGEKEKNLLYAVKVLESGRKKRAKFLVLWVKNKKPVLTRHWLIGI